MRRRAIANFCAIPSALFLLLIGIIHSVVNVVVVLGAAGYLWAPTKPSVLIFPFFGVVLAGPLLVWRREFPNP
jgi:hypothetical protein